MIEIRRINNSSSNLRHLQWLLNLLEIDYKITHSEEDNTPSGIIVVDSNGTEQSIKTFVNSLF